MPSVGGLAEERRFGFGVLFDVVEATGFASGVKVRVPTRAPRPLPNVVGLIVASTPREGRIPKR